MGVIMVLISIYFFTFASKCEKSGAIPQQWIIGGAEKSSNPGRFNRMLLIYRFVGAAMAFWGVINLLKFVRSILATS